MRRLGAALLGVVLLCGEGGAAQNFSAKRAAEPPISQPDGRLEAGEKLVFDVYWMGFHVGEGTLEVAEKTELRGRPAYHVVAIAKTNEFLSKIYPIHDEIHSWIDAGRPRSLEFRKKVSEGRYRADEIVVYDHDAGKGFYESVWNKSKKEFPIERDCHDLVSAFFWFRMQPSKPGEKLRTRVNGEDKHWDMEFDVIRREPKELRGGTTVDALFVEPKTRLEGVLYNRGRVWVWFTSGSRRVPFEVRMKTPFGPVIGILRNREALEDEARPA